MAKGTSILVSTEPKGVFLEGIVSGTPVPGTVMEVKPAVAPVGGRFTYQVWSKSSGAKGLVAVLLGDDLQGKISVGANATFTASGGAGGGTYQATGDAYVDGTRCFLYCPAAGEDMNLVFHNVAGTADDIGIGDLFGVEQNTGHLIANSSYANPCFQALETVTDPTADCVVWVKFLGH